MNIKQMLITDIVPYENNPRNNDNAVEATANSIKEFGWQQPIVVDHDNVIIVGHTRLRAAKRLGLERVPVIVADNLTDEQVKAYRLVDNKTSELADWDENLLASELEELKDLDFDMPEFGFEELNDLENQQKDENTEPATINDKTIIIIEADNEDELEQYFAKLVEEGYPCRISTL